MRKTPKGGDKLGQLSMKACRINANLTQAETADKMGISREYYNKLENGEAPMQTYMQYAFSHVVGISLEHIIFPKKSSKTEP